MRALVRGFGDAVRLGRGPTRGWQVSSGAARAGQIRAARRFPRCPVCASQCGPTCRRAGLDHHSGHRASCETAGPHSGPYGTRASRRVRCADRAPSAAVMIKAGAQRSMSPPVAAGQSVSGMARAYRESPVGAAVRDSICAIIRIRGTHSSPRHQCSRQCPAGSARPRPQGVASLPLGALPPADG